MKYSIKNKGGNKVLEAEPIRSVSMKKHLQMSVVGIVVSLYVCIITLIVLVLAITNPPVKGESSSGNMDLALYIL